MPLRRRQILILGGSLAGFGLVVAGGKWLGGNPSSTSQSSNGTVRNGSVSGSDAAVLASDSGTDPDSSPSTGDVPPADGRFRLVILGDLVDRTGAVEYDPLLKETIARLPALKPDLVICTGDMVGGGSSSVAEDRLRAMWWAFDRAIANPLKREGIPFAIALGDRDASREVAVQGGFLYDTDRDMAEEFWESSQRQPGLQFLDKGSFPFYYTFQQSNIFFIVFEASTPWVSQRQLNWLDATLSSSTARSARLRIAIGHFPLYGVTDSYNETAQVLTKADELRSLLEKHKVQTYISGHHRTFYPGQRGNLDVLYVGSAVAPFAPMGSDTLPQRTLTVLDIDTKPAPNDRRIDYAAYTLPTFEALPLDSLPKYVNGKNGAILRQDTPWAALPDAEKKALEKAYPNPDAKETSEATNQASDEEKAKDNN